jgi:hypothetical protein
MKYLMVMKQFGSLLILYNKKHRKNNVKLLIIKGIRRYYGNNYLLFIRLILNFAHFLL